MTQETQVSTAIASAFAAIVMDISKKGADKKYVKVGDVTIHIPVLSAFGITAELAKDKEGKEVYEDGLPVYQTEEANWLQGAIAAQVKAQARNKLQPGTATLKDGAKIATNFAELCAEGDRSGNAAALQAIRDLKNLFAKWVSTLGKSQAAQNLLTGLFGNKQALAIQTDDNKGKMSQYISDFAETLTADQLALATKYLQSLLDACSSSVSADDF